MIQMPKKRVTRNCKSWCKRVRAVLDKVGGGTPNKLRPARLLAAIHYDIIQLLIASGDAIIILLASTAGAYGYQLYIGDSSHLGTYLALGLIASLAYASIAYYFDLYSLPNLLNPRFDFWSTIIAWITAVLILSVVLFLLKIGNVISRGSVICLFSLGTLALLGWRKTIKSSLNKAFDKGLIRGRRALLIGTCAELGTISNEYLLRDFGIEESDRMIFAQSHSADAVFDSTTTVVKTIIDRAHEVSAEEIILAIPWRASNQLLLIRDQFRSTPLPVRLAPDHAVRSVLQFESGRIKQQFLICIQREPLARHERFIKRLFDIIAAASLLIILSPLMLVTAAAIKLNSCGSVIFRQQRAGFSTKPFTIYKFRTMNVSDDGPEIEQAKQNDSRVTRLGSLLRRMSIDELPQLFNILKGDMSLVGPRPHPIALDDKYSKLVADYAFRCHVKPGLTGWAQVHGLRGETRHVERMEKRVQFDLWYINNWSLGLDLHIIARTCVELIRAQNAY